MINFTKFLSEECNKKQSEQIDELSKDKLEKYINKSIEDHGNSKFAQNNSYGQERQYWKERSRKRNSGIALAIRKSDKKDSE